MLKQFPSQTQIKQFSSQIQLKQFSSETQHKQFPSQTQLAQSSWLILVMKVSPIIHPQITNPAAAKPALKLLGILANPEPGSRLP